MYNSYIRIRHFLQEDSMGKVVRFDNEPLFREFVSKYGMNLFLGAGFSTYAYNDQPEALPLGAAIADRLCDVFGLEKSRYDNLGKVCRKIKKEQEDALSSFLRDTYKVKRYDDAYSCLYKLPIRSIISINIDNLVEKVFEEQDSPKDLSDVRINGDLAKDNIVPLYKLHGSVTYPFDVPLSFTEEELHSLFVTDNRLFQTVSYKISCSPTLFWGTSLSDGNTAQLLCDARIKSTVSMPKWIVLYPNDKKYEFLCEEYEDRGFNIIGADTKDLLTYLSTMPFVTSKSKDKYIYRKYREQFPRNFVCNELKKASMARPITDFFHGAEPQISDVLSSNVVKTSYYSTIQNAIISNKTTLVTGIPGCGKSTLLLQLAFSDEVNGHKFWFNNMIASEAKRLCKLIKDDKNAIVFFDNLYSNLDAYKILKEHNIKMVVAERGINYEYVKSFLSIPAKNIIDVSDLNENDIQNICRSMNKPSKEAIEMLKRKSNVSLLELVFLAYHNQTTDARIKEYIHAIQNLVDPSLKIDMLELYTLVNYVSFCGVPTSMDMFIFYFNDPEITYSDIYYALDKLNSIIVEDKDAGLIDTSQDYMAMRSKLFAHLSLKHIPRLTLKKVLKNFLSNVSPSIVYRYDIFRKKAYDADITVSAFNKDEGIEFYNELAATSGSPYTKHQFALFLQRKKDIDMAWRVIDQANTDCGGKIFTIANTHAMILFEKNIGVHCESDKLPDLKEILNRSFETLHYCVTKDVRVNYHVLVYSRNTIRYIERFGMDDYAKEYVENSLARINAILSSGEFMYRKLREEFVSQEHTIHELKKNGTPSRDAVTIS